MPVEGRSPGSRTRTKQHGMEVGESEDGYVLRMEAPQFIFAATAQDSSGNAVSIQAAIMVEGWCRTARTRSSPSIWQTSRERSWP